MGAKELYESLARRMEGQDKLRISYSNAGDVYVFKKGADKPYFEVHSGIVGKTKDGKKTVQAIFKAVISEEGVALKKEDLRGWKKASVLGKEDDGPVTILSVEEQVTSVKTRGGSYATKSVRRLSKSDAAVEGALGVVLPVLLSEEGDGQIAEKLAEALEGVDFESKDMIYEVGVDNFKKFKLKGLIVRQAEGGDANVYYANPATAKAGVLSWTVPADAVRELDEFVEKVKKARGKDEKIEDFLRNWLLSCSKRPDLSAESADVGLTPSL